MFKKIIKWHISRTIDLRRQPAPWLQRWTERDKELLDFQQQSQRIADRLRGDAESWLVLCESREHGGLPESSTLPSTRAKSGEIKTAWIRALAVAAGVTFVCLIRPLWVDGVNKSISERTGSSATRRTQSTNDHDWFVDAYKVGLKWARVVPQRIQSLRGGYRPSLGSAKALLKNPAQSSASILVRLLAAIDVGMAEECGGIEHHARASWTYFTHKLPSSAAQLVCQGIPHVGQLQNSQP
jgi:hypothetical protein